MSESPTLPRAWLIRALKLEADAGTSAADAALGALDALAAAASSDPAPEQDALQTYSRRLYRVRPSSPLISKVLDEFVALLAAGESATGAAARVRSALDAARSSLVARAEEAFRPGLRVVALGDTPLVREMLLRYADRLEAVVISEGRPNNAGVGLATALAAQALPARLITESQLPAALQASGLAVAEAERVLPNGDVVAPTGTQLLGQLCTAYRVPFYVAAPRALWIEERDPLAHFTPEQRSPAALLNPPVPGVEVTNPPFDLTPANLVSGYLTEDGVQRRIT